MHECKNSVRAACSVFVFLGVQCVRICICIDRLAFFFPFWQFLSVFLISVFLYLFGACLFGCSCVPSPSAETHDLVWVLLLPLCFFHFLFVLLVWSLLLLFLFLASEWQFVVWLVLCLASTRLGRTVAPTVGIVNPARGAFYVS